MSFPLSILISKNICKINSLNYLPRFEDCNRGQITSYQFIILRNNCFIWKHAIKIFIYVKYVFVLSLCVCVCIYNFLGMNFCLLLTCIKQKYMQQSAKKYEWFLYIIFWYNTNSYQNTRMYDILIAIKYIYLIQYIP